MPHILIDGYNLLPVTAFRDREQLIQALVSYRRRKGHEVTVVFDGTHKGTGSGDRDYSSGVEIIYSPLTVTADDEIEEMLPRLNPGSTIVVTSDRKIQSAARRVGATFIESAEFAKRLNSKSGHDSLEAPPPWMEGRTDEDSPQIKKGNPRKLSKEDRKRKKELKKL
jgi:predicted RNA-binding protein with PIN domain